MQLLFDKYNKKQLEQQRREAVLRQIEEDNQDRQRARALKCCAHPKLRAKRGSNFGCNGEQLKKILLILGVTLTLRITLFKQK